VPYKMFLKLLQENVKQGVLNLHLPQGESYRFGDQGLEAHWVINGEQTISRIARDWEYQLGETYINGEWDVSDCELRDLLYILRSNFAEYSISKWLRPMAKIAHEWNKVSRSYNNVSQHYDLDASFFKLFLDKEMHYSCAYFPDRFTSLEQAQAEKCRLIARKLILKPGQKILDIGCGWGSLAFNLAKYEDIEIVGITLSKEQLVVAQQRAKELGIKNVQFKLQDYREHGGEYDRIVSVGMFEHVGKPYYHTYFECIQDLLKNDGVALIHTIGRSGPPGLTNPWIRQHIFPGGSVPSLSEMAKCVEDANLISTDIEVLRLHYAQTLREWLKRFQQNRAEIKQKMGEKFYRMWEFYLTICEVSFQFSDSVVYQLQLAKQHDVVPPTRDYLFTGEVNEAPIKIQKLM